MRLPPLTARIVWRFVPLFAILFWQQTAHSDSPTAWQAGFAKATITPEQPMWLSGYGGRTKPAEGKVHDLYARAAALRGPAGKTAVFVSTDLIGVPVKMARVLGAMIEKQHELARADLMLTCSHTHCGPALDHKLSYMLAMNNDDWEQVRSYQAQLNQKLIDLIGKAIDDLKPSRLSTGIGKCEFAANRRAPRGLGPYDHEVPVLRVTTPDGAKLRGIIFGYACHNTTLSFYKWCGDYAGFAALDLEDRHPEAVALFFTGCGADQNPLPRRHVQLAVKYGRLLSVAVDQVLASEMRPVAGRLRTSMQHVELPFHKLPTREEMENEREDGTRYQQARASLLLKQLDQTGALAKSYSYPIQVWELGDFVTWVALGGEVVVDYSIRIKNELGHGRTWVTGYANDVMAYIPSERVLQEGGYEGETSMIVYQLPSKWKSGLENRIVSTVRSLSGWTPLFNGKNLSGWAITKFGGEGEVRVDQAQITLELGNDMTGITWKDANTLPRTNYEVYLEAMRVDGTDFFCGLTFPVKQDPCSLIVGGWGGGVCGLSSIDGLDASENETTTYQPFKTGRWYKIQVRVTENRIEAWIDDQQIVNQEIKGRKISIRPEVELSEPFGIATWQTTGAIRNLNIRKIDVP